MLSHLSWLLLVNRQKSSSPLSVGLCRGKMQHNPILMHLSQCDWNDCRCKAVCPPENSNWYLLSPVSNHPYDPSLQAPRGLFGLSHFLLCLCLACSLAAASSSSSLSIRCHRLVFCLWLRMIEAPCSSVSSVPGGERSRTWANKNCHLLRGVQQTFGDGWENSRVCVFSARVCVCMLSLLPGGRHLISAVAGRKTGQYVGAKMCRR